MSTPTPLRLRRTRDVLWSRSTAVLALLWAAAAATLVGAVMAGAMLALWATHDAFESQLERVQPVFEPLLPLDSYEPYVPPEATHGAPAEAHRT